MLSLSGLSRILFSFPKLNGGKELVGQCASQLAELFRRFPQAVQNYRIGALFKQNANFDAQGRQIFRSASQCDTKTPSTRTRKTPASIQWLTKAFAVSNVSPRMKAFNF
jgi:hypothetical protein